MTPALSTPAACDALPERRRQPAELAAGHPDCLTARGGSGLAGNAGAGPLNSWVPARELKPDFEKDHPAAMPNSPSAKKAMRKAAVRRDRNRAARSALRTVLKRCRQASAGSDRAAAETAFRLAVKKLDQAAAKNLIHKNAAARTKSRLSRLLQKQQPAAS
jgi:small subunit ribosomal protein S20